MFTVTVLRSLSCLSKVVINFKIVRKEQGRRMTDGMFSLAGDRDVMLLYRPTSYSFDWHGRAAVPVPNFPSGELS